MDITVTYNLLIKSIALYVFLLVGGTTFADDCRDTVIIDSGSYPVSDYWCGKKLDSNLIADPTILVPLPQELTFEDYRIYVRPEVRTAFVAMAQAAAVDSIFLTVDSGYRSFSFQRRIIKRRLQSGDSFEKIQLSVAPPGYSEHHTGRALDLCPSEARFAFTPAYRWLCQNAKSFGFTESLPENPAAPLTWESWHWIFINPSD